MCKSLKLLLFFVHTAFSIPKLSKDERLNYLHSLTPSKAANVVREQFISGYNVYKQYAWGCDDVNPDLSPKAQEPRAPMS